VTSRVCRALSAFALFVGAVSMLPGSARADAATAADAAPSAARPVEVGIGAVLPQIPNFNDFTKKMTFSGQLLNTGSVPLKSIHLELQRSMVYNRNDMGSAQGNDYKLASQDFKGTSLAAGATQPWQFSLTETDLFGSHNPAAGVYAIDVDAFDSDGNFLGGQRTYTVWEPKQVKGAQQARIALMWPVVGQPGLTGQKTANNAAAPILADRSTAQQYAPDGRLSKILQEGKTLPLVNWLVDPDVLYTASQLSSSYFIPDPADSSHTPTGAPGTDSNDARNWVAQATALLASPDAQNCWNLLYGDPDLNTLSHSPNGQNVLNAAASVNPPVNTGCRQSGQTVAWPSDGQADAATLAGIAAARVPNLVTLVGSSTATKWPSAHASLPNSPNTVVYDNALSSIFADPAKTTQSPVDNVGVLAGQKWLAETALAAREGSGTLVVTPPRDFDPPQQLLDAVNAMQSVPTANQWFGLDPLSQVTASPAASQKTSALTKIATANLPASTVDSASDSAQLYHSLHAIMPNHPADAAVPFRPVATWWRNHGGGAVFAKTVYTTVVNDHGLVSFGQQTPPLTMSGKTGTVPVTIRNDTDAAIVIYLRAQDQGAHTMELKVNEDQGAHTVLPGQVNTVRIPVQALGNGQQVVLVAKLYTCGDQKQNCTYYPANLIKPLNNDGSTNVTVKVSRIGIIALSLMIGSGMLLILLIGLRVYRAKRTHHAPAQDTMAS
jgi:hypothetical protein